MKVMTIRTEEAIADNLRPGNGSSRNDELSIT